MPDTADYTGQPFGPYTPNRPKPETDLNNLNKQTLKVVSRGVSRKGSLRPSAAEILARHRGLYGSARSARRRDPPKQTRASQPCGERSGDARNDLGAPRPTLPAETEQTTTDLNRPKQTPCSPLPLPPPPLSRRSLLSPSPAPPVTYPPPPPSPPAHNGNGPRCPSVDPSLNSPKQPPPPLPCHLPPVEKGPKPRFPSVDPPHPPEKAQNPPSPTGDSRLQRTLGVRPRLDSRRERKGPKMTKLFFANYDAIRRNTTAYDVIRRNMTN